ncbi:hypothetical protein MAP00_007460 [Monascus purpureus]|nr:hypothetical protein MAP00_007460 [Monascus purpureus]
MWIGLLFGVMCLGAAFQRQRSSQMPDPQQLVRLYREKIIQCLVVGKYAKCAPYTLETLLLYLNIEYLQSEDTRVETWILLGVIVRLALRMGYHRDASHFPHISPFAAEMRRRVWALIVQFDCLTSAQVGLPRMIRDSQSDTAEPRNLLDEDFDENSTALPLPQPSTVQTPVQYIVAKNRIVAVFGRICDLITSSNAPSYPEVMQLDETLHDTYRSVPGGLQMRPMTRSLTDGATVILRRMYIVLLYHKAVCMLHHRYMIPARTDGRYAYSRSTCVAAALQILSHQWTLHNETQPGGRLYEERWKVSSLVKSTFFLGTTILCAELDCSLHKEPADAEQSPAETGLRQQVIQALHNSYTVWLQASDSSREARLAADVSGLLLTRAQRKWRPAEMRQVGNMAMSSESPFMGVSIPPQSATMASAAPVEQPLSMPQLLQFNTAAHIDYSDLGAEPLGLSQGVDDMLAMSMTFPRMFNVPV